MPQGAIKHGVEGRVGVWGSKVGAGAEGVVTTMAEDAKKQQPQRQHQQQHQNQNQKQQKKRKQKRKTRKDQSKLTPTQSPQETKDLILPISQIGYGDQGYWEERYKLHPVPFEWYIEAGDFVACVEGELENSRGRQEEVLWEEFWKLAHVKVKGLTPKEAAKAAKEAEEKKKKRDAVGDIDEAKFERLLARNKNVASLQKKKMDPDELETAWLSAAQCKDSERHEATVNWTGFLAWWRSASIGGVPRLADMRVLELGGGTSAVASLLSLRWHCASVKSIDISPTAVALLTARADTSSTSPSCSPAGPASSSSDFSSSSRSIVRPVYEVQDACSLKDAEDTYDLILDKGTLDSILCAENSEKGALSMLLECSRVLKPGGHLLVLGSGPCAVAHSRVELFKASRFPWTVRVSKLGGSLELFTMTKLYDR